MRLPTDKKFPVTLKFGAVNSAYYHGKHPGVDYGTPTGTPIKSTVGGKVVRAGFDRTGFGYGNLVVVQGGGYFWFYAHLDSISVKNGQSVKEGQQLGRSGRTGWATGPHLHLETRTSGAIPAPWSAYRDPIKVLADGMKPKPKKSIDTIAKEVIAGKWGNGVVRVARLKAAGYNPSSVQAAVNKLLAPKPKPKPKAVYLTVKKNEGLSHLAKRAGYKDFGKSARWQAITNLNKKVSWQSFNKSLKVGQKVRVK